MTTRKTMNLRSFGWLTVPAIALGAVACGGGSSNVVTCEEGFVLNAMTNTCEIIVQDVPGLNPAAARAFAEGVNHLNQTPPAYQDALASFEQAYAADEDFWEALENIGLLQMDLGMYDEAIDTFTMEQNKIDDLIERQWPVDPRPEIMLNIGKAQALDGRLQAAQATFQEAANVESLRIEATANLAAVSLRMGSFEAAESYIAELLEASRNDPNALSVLALVYKEQGDMQMAEYLWQNTLGYIDATITALEDEEQYEDLSEDEAEMLRRYNEERSARMLQSLSAIQNELGIVEWQNGDHDAAEVMFRSAVNNDPQNYAAHVNVATIYLDYSSFNQACAHFDEALALRPTHEMAMIGKGSCLYGGGDVEAAFDAFMAAAEAHDNNAYIAQRIGEIAFQDLNDQATAVEWLNRNLSLRGMNESSCDSTDSVCAMIQGIRMMQQMNQGADGG